jgi:hypothetical protein
MWIQDRNNFLAGPLVYYTIEDNTAGYMILGNISQNFAIFLSDALLVSISLSCLLQATLSLDSGFISRYTAATLYLAPGHWSSCSPLCAWSWSLVSVLYTCTLL